jgi:dolichyl-phosphate-mannose--protein O-mannosyl transferase
MMFILNAGLLFIVFLTVRRTFNEDAFAVACLAFLVIDPTIAAHMPVVLTDLPLALLSITAVLSAVVAFRTWRLWDLLLTAAALGLVLAAKHSGLVTCAMVLALGAVQAFQIALASSQPLESVTPLRNLKLSEALAEVK